MDMKPVLAAAYAVLLALPATPAMADALGDQWFIDEVDGWSGIWTRDAGTDEFDADYRHRDGQAIGGRLRIEISGSSVAVHRWNSGTWGTCDYKGTLSGTVAGYPYVVGSYSCTVESGASTPTYGWSAIVVGADASPGSPAPTTGDMDLFDGVYAGSARIEPGARCLADGYDIVMTVSGGRFEATVTRIGGSSAGSTFSVGGAVDATGRFVGDSLGGVNQASFTGTLAGGMASGTSGGSGCDWSFDLPRQG